MVKEAARKCSHCGHNGHNSRTCNGKGCFKLFGVNIMEKTEQTLKKSVSMGNLQSHAAENAVSVVDTGYLSDGQINSKRCKAAHERKKGMPWTENEHRTFLAGLKKFGKGDWRGISKNFVPTRTPTQVASHAQKYFLRHSSNDKKKRRSSLFDMPLKQYELTPQESPVRPLNKTTRTLPQASTSSALPLTAGVPAQADTPAEIAKRFPHLCLDDRVLPVAAACAVPNYQGIQYMVGVPGNGQRFGETRMMHHPSLSFVSTINYPRAAGYVHIPKTIGNFATCAPVTVHPSGIPPPRSPRNGMFQAGPRTTSTGKDPLELKIGPPQSPQRNLSSQAPGAISVT